MSNFKGIKRMLIFTVVIVATVFSSCRTTRDAVVDDLRPMNTNRLMRRVLREAPNYRNYDAKRISVIVNDNGDRNTFSGQLAIDHDKSILLTARKLNIPVVRAHLTPDSVIMINYFDRNFVRDDIGALQNLFGFDADFQLIQALLTADVSKLVNNEMFDKDLVSDVDSYMYRIDSQFNNRAERVFASGNERRIARFMDRADDTELIQYSAWIDPRLFVVRRITFTNIKLDETITVEYNEYESIGRNLFPQHIVFEMGSSRQKMSVDIKLSRTSVNKPIDNTILIPEQYNQYNISRNR